VNALGWTFVVLFLVGWVLYTYRQGQRRWAQNHKDAPVPKKQESAPMPKKPRFEPSKPEVMKRWLDDDEPEAEPGFIWMKHEVDEKTGEVKF